MFIFSDTGNRFVAAISAIAISAVFMATAIIPATPGIGVIA
ncbi:recombination protein F [Altererythrobacter sp.]